MAERYQKSIKVTGSLENAFQVCKNICTNNKNCLPGGKQFGIGMYLAKMSVSALRRSSLPPWTGPL